MATKKTRGFITYKNGKKMFLHSYYTDEEFEAIKENPKSKNITKPTEENLSNGDGGFIWKYKNMRNQIVVTRAYYTEEQAADFNCHWIKKAKFKDLIKEE